MDRFLFVCLGGAIGSGLRYLVVTWTQRAFGAAFPWGVFAVNVVGSFLMAVVAIAALHKSGLSEGARLGITAGFLGGLTTYSSFNQDTVTMLEARAYGTAAAYVAATVLVCAAAGALGVVVGRRI